MQGRGAVKRMVGAGLLAVALAADAATLPEQQQKNVMPKLSEPQLLNAPSQIPQRVAAGELALTAVPNPHWRRDACQACHRGTPTRAQLRLRDSDINRLCNTCHAALSDHSYIHPTGMPVPKDMQARLSRSYREAVARARGTVSCITCHDLPMTCRAERAGERALNPRFFREGPYRERGALCYRCHDPAQYARLNPHEQVEVDGSLRESSCRVCHDRSPDVAAARTIRDVDFTVAGDLSRLCTGCHPVKPHPGGFSFGPQGQPDHLRVPSARVAQRLERMQRVNQVALPLDPNTGKVFCATCHNPHARGVVKVAAAARGAGEKDRLRMPEMCGNCHDK
jgi:predicted CXXCH cytochrome family protein